LNLKSQILQENLPIPENFFSLIQQYKEHLFRWNKIHNLTGAKDEATIDAFIFDAVFPISFLPKIETMMDIGSGAGFPGMILAMALPNTQVTLVEPLAKRASFLQFIKASLGLDNVEVVKKRVEEMEPRIFELITSRAVTQTDMLLKLSRNFRDKDTQLLFYKGENVYDEVKNYKNYKIITGHKRHYLLMNGDDNDI